MTMGVRSIRIATAYRSIKSAAGTYLMDLAMPWRLRKSARCGKIRLPRKASRDTRTLVAFSSFSTPATTASAAFVCPIDAPWLHQPRASHAFRLSGSSSIASTGRFLILRERFPNEHSALLGCPPLQPPHPGGVISGARSGAETALRRNRLITRTRKARADSGPLLRQARRESRHVLVS